MKTRDKKTTVSILVGIIIAAVLLVIPTGYEDALIYKGTDRVSALVLETNESAVHSSGIIQFGEQSCVVRLLAGRFKGKETSAVNMLLGSLDQDKIFAPGDKALVVVSYAGGDIISVTMIDHYRLPVTIALAAAFGVLLILFAGRSGVRAILSFAITVLAIWKVLVPCLLYNISPIAAGLSVTVFLAVTITSLVYGPDMRCLSATLGTVLGIAATCAVSYAFTGLFKIHGAVMEYSQSLIYSGFEYLNLTEIFKASVFIVASGAVMDLAVDITSSIYEVVCKVPDISWRDAMKSGMNVGRAAMGTMTTTLLIAYSGGYVMLLMALMAQGTPVGNILNYNNVSAEILNTLIGCLGLVTVAPFTALTGGLLLTQSRRRQSAVSRAD